MTLSATEMMQRELERMNQLKGVHDSVAAFNTRISSFDMLSKLSMFETSSAVQRAFESVSLLGPLQDFITRNATSRLFDYDLGLGKLANLNFSSAAQRALESMGSINVIKDSLAMQKLHSIGILGDIQRHQEIAQSVERFLKPIPGLDAIRESITVRATAGLGVYEEIQKAMRPYSSLDMAAKASMSLLELNSIQDAVGFRASAIQQAMKTMNHVGLFERLEPFQNTISQMQSLGVLTKSFQALNRDNIFAQAVTSFNAMTYQMHFEPSISDAELSECINLIETTPETAFIDIFPKLHPYLQAVLIFLFKTVLLGIVIGISGNLLTPYAEKMLKSGKLTTDQIRAAKKTPLQDVDTANLRFIFRNGVKLRAKPSTRSEILDVLVAGQVVSVIDRKKNWAEVVYSNDEGQACRGWVMTTYTAKFKK